jgi:hypothetical protein
MYCDDCIQQRMGLKWRQQVQLVTATLAVTASFSRLTGTCSACYRTRQVIRMAALPPPRAGGSTKAVSQPLKAR